MTEAGGCTTQSGIFYQNSVAGLWLGRLLDCSMRAARDRVVSIRVEAPEYVDDIVVQFADGHTEYHQVKEALSRGEVWGKLWLHIGQQWSSGFRSADRIVLTIGKPSPITMDLYEACARAEGKIDELEWQKSLSKNQKSLVNEVFSVLVENSAFHASKFEFFLG